MSILKHELGKNEALRVENSISTVHAFFLIVLHIDSQGRYQTDSDTEDNL